MNVEKWIAGRQRNWRDLEGLIRQIERNGLPSLSREQLQSLGKLYRSASADLSRARGIGLGSDIISYLNNLVVKAHNQVYQSPRSRWRDLWVFFWYTFPGIHRQNILYVLVAFLAFALPAAFCWNTTLNNPDFGHMEVSKGRPIVSEELWSHIEHKRLWTDSAQDMSPTVSSEIATNNIRVSIIAYVLGISAGIGTMIIMVLNGMMLGTVFGLCQVHGMAFKLAQFVAPHGVFELTAIFISGAAGLMVGRALLFPGKHGRADSLRKIGMPSFLMFAGTIPLLLVAGSIEGFISPRTDINQDVKYIVSFATLIILMLYLFVPRGLPKD